MMPHHAILRRWYCAEGAIVRQGEPLCELETNTANVDVPAPQSGRLWHLAEEGDMIAIGVEVGRIEPI